MYKKTILNAVAVMLIAVGGFGHVMGAEEKPTGPSTQILFNIPAGELIAALEKLGERTHLTLVYDRKLVEGKPSAAINGRMRVEDALKQLLEGTGLGWSFVNDDTIVLKGSASSMVGPADQMRVADSSKSGSSRSKSPSSSEEDGQKNQVVVRSDREKQPPPFSTANLDLTRTEDDALPFTVFDARDIELSGTSSLQEFLQNRLPQNFNADIPAEMDGTGTDPAARTNRVDMRGWGAGETVFLLNGRRMMAEYQPDDIFGNNTPNLQSIPLGSIERIEILSSAGSAIYGANATGGVINIITRQDFHGGQLAVQYGSPSDVNAPNRSVSLSYGVPFKWGTNFRLSGGYSDSEPLTRGDRVDVTSGRWRRRALELNPSAAVFYWPSGHPKYVAGALYGLHLWSSGTPRIAASELSGANVNLFSNDPTATPSNLTVSPKGYDGSGGLDAFEPGGYDLDRLDLADTLGVASTSKTLNVGIDKNFGERWRWSVDYRYSENESNGRSTSPFGFTTGGITSTNPPVPANAPTNPFGVDVKVNGYDPRLNDQTRNKPKNVSWSWSSTLRGEIGEWRGFVDFDYSHNSIRYASTHFYEPNGGWYNALLSGAYNPFVDAQVVPPASEEFYRNAIVIRNFSRNATRSYQSAVKASGPIFHLPAGAALLTAGMGWMRSNNYENYRYGEYQDAITGEPRIPIGNQSSVNEEFSSKNEHRFVFDSYSAYAEANLPVLSAAQDFPLVKRLELFGSSRLDRTVRNGFSWLDGSPLKYTDSSSLHAFGFRYEILEGLMLRGSQSIGFKPPNLGEVTPALPLAPSAPDIVGLYDPRRNDEPVSLTYSMRAGGGNPEIKPETTNSTNIGVIFSPYWLADAGTRISIDYLESVRNDAITGLDLQGMINLEADFPGRVQRGAPDEDPSGVGRITFVDQRYVNLLQVASKSMDFSVEQRWQTASGGQMVVTAVASRNISFKVQTTHTSPAVEQVRNIDSLFSQQIEWNGNAQVRWEGRNWGFGWSTRYFDYILAQPSNRNYPLQGGDRAPRAFNHDLNVNYQASSWNDPKGWQRLLSGTSIAFGIKNVFDRKPRFWAAATDYGVAPYDSIEGRNIWMQVRRDF